MTERTIRIADQDFTITDRFAEGHVLTANQAAALNQTLAENIGNNHRKAIKDAIEANSFDHAVFQSTLSESVQSYEFGVRRTGGSRVPVDPVEKEALRLAVEAVKAAIRKAGHTNVPVEVIRAKAEEALADEVKGAKLRKIAKQNVNALAAITESGEGDTPELAAGIESGPARKRGSKTEPEAAAA